MKVFFTQKWTALKADRLVAKQTKQLSREIDRNEQAQLRVKAMAERHVAAGLALPPASFSAACQRLDRLSPSQMAWCVVNLPGFEGWPRTDADTKEHLGAPYPATNEFK